MAFRKLSDLPRDIGLAYDLETEQMARWNGTEFIPIGNNGGSTGVSGIWEKRFEQEIILNSGWSNPLDTGIVIEDATEYEIILSAIAGTTGTASSRNGLLAPRLRAKNGTLGSDLMTYSAGAYALLSAIFNFRGQIHPLDTDATQKVVTVHPMASGEYGAAITANIGSVQVDDPAASPGTSATQLSIFGIRNIIAADDDFTICLSQPNAYPSAPTVNIRYICKVYAKKG